MTDSTAGALGTPPPDSPAALLTGAPAEASIATPLQSPLQTLAVDRLAVTLRLAAPVKLHFHHGGALMGLLCAALRTHDLPDGLMPFVCEAGRVRFQAGDTYRLGLTLVGSARHIRQQLLDGLRRVGASQADPTEGPTPSFGRGFDMVSVDELPAPNVIRQCEALGGRHHVTLRFVSPFRLARPDDRRAPGAGYLNGDCFPAPYFLDRLLNRVFRLVNGRNATRDERRLLAPDPTLVTATAEHLFWLDVPIVSRPEMRAERKKGLTLGGVLGTVGLSDVPVEWWPWIVAGSLVHAGESTHYGLGAYRLCGEDLDGETDFKPSATLLFCMSTPDALASAFRHVKERSDAPGVDGQAPAAFEEHLAQEATDLHTDLAKGRYTAAPLLGFVGSKPGAHLRALAIPTVRDRVAQRAACELLQPVLDTLFEDCSFAYRKGFSRQGAARAIQRAYDDGYRWVLDADITSFFDTVDWTRLFSRLHALFPFDPLVEVIKSWVRAPVMFKGHRIERRHGLPQGTPISPLLANLFLDEFDEELLGEDYRLVRYADDFVVLCKDAEEAKRAKADAATALAKLGLTLNESKTDIRSVESGFDYLGYLFCQSLAMDKEPGAPAAARPATPEDVPKASWLAQVPFERIRPLGRSASAPPPEPAVQAVPLQQEPDDQGTKRPLYVISSLAQIYLRDTVLTVERPDKPIARHPIRAISHVVVCGRSRVTMPLVLKLNRLGVPVYFCSATGGLITAVTPHEPSWPLWLAQARAIADPQTTLAFSKEMVASKLHNAAALVVRFRFDDAARAAADIRAIARSAAGAEGVATLLGYEGSGAARYFEALGASLGPEWQFEGRRKRPPTDPINSLLSFGYHILYNHVSTALVSAGLNPCLGLYHRGRGSHHALASDLMEQFRFLVDAVVWAVVQKRQVKPEDFTLSTDGTGQTLMTSDCRKMFIGEVDRRLLTAFTPSTGHTMTYRAFIDRQAKQFSRFASGAQPRYEAYRLRA